MYEVKKRLEISAAHKLKLDYESKCTNLHGHNWIVDVYLRSETLDNNGMVMDFTHIKKKIQDKFDHKIINGQSSPYIAIFTVSGSETDRGARNGRDQARI